METRVGDLDCPYRLQCLLGHTPHCLHIVCAGSLSVCAECHLLRLIQLWDNEGHRKQDNKVEGIQALVKDSRIQDFKGDLQAQFHKEDNTHFDNNKKLVTKTSSKSDEIKIQKLCREMKQVFNHRLAIR